MEHFISSNEDLSYSSHIAHTTTPRTYTNEAFA